MLRLIALVALLHAQAPAPSFAQTVLRDFDAWDRNGDGVLSPEEIGRAALDPRYHGEDAAALAALHVWLNATKDATPLTKAWFAGYQPVRLQLSRDLPADERKRARKAYDATPGSLQSAFAGDLRRLAKAGRTELFQNDGPALTDIRQGALGDCYMLAPLGAMIHRDPESVRRMIQPDGEGYRVAFGDGKTVRVGPLTDAELATGGSTVANGLWIRVVEKAYGSRDFKDGEARLSRDTMGGGRPGVAGRGFTGHRFTSLALVGDFRKEVPDTEVEPKLDRLRREVPETLGAGRLVLAATPHGEVPTSVTPGHAYAVFGYDPKTDRITLWNPHGNDFRPRGEEGVENGYERAGGVFSMPLPAFAHAFSRIFFEGVAG